MGGGRSWSAFARGQLLCGEALECWIIWPCALKLPLSLWYFAFCPYFSPLNESVISENGRNRDPCQKKVPLGTRVLKYGPTWEQCTGGQSLCSPLGLCAGQVQSQSSLLSWWQSHVNLPDWCTALYTCKFQEPSWTVDLWTNKLCLDQMNFQIVSDDYLPWQLGESILEPKLHIFLSF